MHTQEEAEEFLKKLYACRPKPFFDKIDEIQRGMNFVLIYLKETNHEVLAGELAKELHVSTARIAALLKTMEKNALIERHHSDTDARHTIVKITQTGMEQAEEIRAYIITKTELLLEKIDKQELEEFIRISSKIRDVLEE
ncbi:MAG: MarR family transcriptional regulator [Ruminococcus sp.]|nr:MarR family transcriptional regulator [Ruminococcus sp.]